MSPEVACSYLQGTVREKVGTLQDVAASYMDIYEQDCGSVAVHLARRWPVIACRLQAAVNSDALRAGCADGHRSTAGQALTRRVLWAFRFRPFRFRLLLLYMYYFFSPLFPLHLMPQRAGSELTSPRGREPIAPPGGREEVGCYFFNTQWFCNLAISPFLAV